MKHNHKSHYELDVHTIKIYVEWAFWLTLIGGIISALMS